MRNNKQITHIITAAGTTISILSPAYSGFVPKWLIPMSVAIGLICFAYLVYDEIKSNAKNECVCRSERDIERAMMGIIKSQGKICIMSRDLSWVTPQISACLEAKRDNTLIFAQSENETTRTLASRGVNVKYYGELDFEPNTRFTIIRYNKNDAQVAIANVENSVRRNTRFKHVIYQTSARGSTQDEWINSLARDMVNLCNVVCKGK